MRFSVLVVEDHPDEAVLLRHAFARAAVEGRFVSDAPAAIDVLSKPSPPSLVMLDLSLPVVSGFELLTWIRSRPALRGMPVLVFSGTRDAGDFDRARELGANACLLKPIDFNGLQEIVGAIVSFWSLIDRE